MPAALVRVGVGVSAPANCSRDDVVSLVGYMVVVVVLLLCSNEKNEGFRVLFVLLSECLRDELLR